ncbi:hypothetical protein [Cronobacter dublinensis]|uniref:hypothetical protein n=1 Tax=Cronobacter dublinensis TaxID=413497 RepID=UPI00300E024D
MSRNKIAMSTYIFERIHSSASTNDPLYLIDSKSRYLARKDEDDVNLMTHAAVNVLALGAKMFLVTIRYKEDYYYCFSGVPVPAKLPPNLEEVAATPGLFACIIYCAQLESLATASQARDILEEQYLGQEGYEGHDLDDIALLFPNLYFIKSNNHAELSYLSQQERVAGAFIASGYPGHPLEIDKALQGRILNLFLTGAETIPYDLPLKGLLSYSWSSLFLDLYRCLEQLYTSLKLMSLVEKIPFDGTLAELASILENELSWRPKEQEALGGILSHTSEETRRKIMNAFDKSALDYAPAKCASYIYKLRNSHVHFRPAMRAEAKNAKQWNEILIAMCDAVDEIYEALGDGFLNAKTNPLAKS